jgi:hypothetical protein
MSTLRTSYQLAMNMQGRACGHSQTVNRRAAGLSPFQAPSPTESLSADDMSIALIGPNELRREEVAMVAARCANCEVHAFASRILPAWTMCPGCWNSTTT